MKSTRVAIVDDHKILREGLKLMLSNMEDVEVVLEASNGKEFVDEVTKLKPDLAIIDYDMPVMKGDEAIVRAHEKLPQLKIIVLSMHRGVQFFEKISKLNVCGYIIKESDFEELEHAIHTVMKGGKYFSQELLLGMINNKSTHQEVEFSEREKKILYCMCKGNSTKEIAGKLLIGTRSIEKHRSEMLEKTSSPNSLSLVVYAIKNGIVEP